MPAPVTGARPAPRPAPAGPTSPGGGLREALLARLRPVPMGERGRPGHGLAG